jgi:hypothetical protein
MTRSNDGISRRKALQKGGVVLGGSILGLSSTSTSVAAEPTEVSDCTSISEPGTYVLTEDIDIDGDCFELRNTDILLDGNGHTISGDGTGTGIFVEGGAEVRNLTVANFQRGYYIEHEFDEALTLENAVVADNAAGITGSLKSNMNIRNSVLRDNEVGISGNEAFGITIIESTLRGNGSAVTTGDGNIMEIEDSAIENNDAGISAGVGTFTNNTFANNGGYGLQLIGLIAPADFGPITIVGNNILNNAGPGIEFTSGVGTVRENTITNNESGIVITGDFFAAGNLPPDYKITRNNIEDNANFGIKNDSDDEFDGQVTTRAPCNYWGDPTGPVHPENPLDDPKGEVISGYVELVPWAVEPIQDGDALCVGGRSIGEFQSQPTDPDDDGLYEDINGDGESDIVDVQALFSNSDDEVIQNNPGAFDFNDDGSVNVADVQKLFKLLC